MKKLIAYRNKKKTINLGLEYWNKIINNENGQRPSFEDYVDVDNEIMVSGVLSEDNIV